MCTEYTTLDQLHNVPSLLNTRIPVKNKTVALDERMRTGRKHAGFIVGQAIPNRTQINENDRGLRSVILKRTRIIQYNVEVISLIA